ncbi:MAG TPA: VOC family protein [Chloroflexota bacterium]|nr:VOC family protein [Chloroflexota bacterium]
MAIASPQTGQVKTPAPTFVRPIHEGFPVKDAEVSLKFYTEVLGLKVLTYRPAALGTGYWVGTDDGIVQFHIIQSDKDFIPGPDAAIRPTGRHTAWYVDDINALRSRLDDFGIEHSEINTLIGAVQLFCKDPDGHTWEFQQVPAAQ